jgi:glycosyltransferase involved in cell wall biosynthesis
MKIEVCARGADPQNVTAVPMGVDTADIVAAGRREPVAVDRELKLGYLGVLDANRHLEVLVDMLGLLRQSGIPVRLLLIGGADERQDREMLEKRAAALGVSQHMEITGILPRVEALKRISAVNICLSPIHPSPIFRVASPTKLVEYLALGLPVIANKHPEQRMILRECRAGVCVPWGARYFTRAVRWLLGRSDAELKLMGDRGRLWVNEHRTYSRIADQVEREYLALIPAGNESRSLCR